MQLSQQETEGCGLKKKNPQTHTAKKNCIHVNLFFFLSFTPELQACKRPLFLIPPYGLPLLH